MMDGQVTYLKKILEKNNFKKVKIMSYSSKHNSCLYSPFRSNNFFKSVCIDKSSYQNSYNNLHESIREIILDINEGADWVMVKPSLWYMDIVQMVKRYIDKPLVVKTFPENMLFWKLCLKRNGLMKLNGLPYLYCLLKEQEQTKLFLILSLNY